MPAPLHLSLKKIDIPAYLAEHMVRIEGDEFMMGAADNDTEAYSSEKPCHKVSVPSFYLMRYPVIQALWEAVIGENPSEFKGPLRPVETVSWDDVQEFCLRLNAELGLSADGGYRLPTEAEWEFAARGGKLSKGYLYAGSDKIKEVGWFGNWGESEVRYNSHDDTKIVGLKAPNELGLCDMSGNVREWCQDRWHDNYDGAPEDGSAWEVGDSGRRVLHGGSWISNPRSCRVSYRLGFDPGDRSSRRGFRLACTVPPVSGPLAFR